MFIYKYLLYFSVILPFALTIDPSDIVITIISQKEGYHAAHANLLKRTILDAADALQKGHPHILLTHEIEAKKNLRSSWTFYPLIPTLATEHADAQWHVFCLENTVIRLEKLLKTLSTFNSSSNIWLGHVLHDKEPTIIHHFADTRKPLKYPNLASAFAVSGSLMKSLNQRITNEGFAKTDFFIDPSYEFASFIYNDGKGIRLSHSPEFCVVATKDCATYPKFFHACGDVVPLEKIFFAVKTFDENHRKRIPVLQKTWLKFAKNYAFFSNRKDANLENIVVVTHTTQGHCQKTFDLLQYANKMAKEKKIHWIVVADDDTILSVSRLSRFLTCYNPKNPVAIGERYGFRVKEPAGYDYLTGGAGLVLSAPLVEEIVTSEACRCPMPTTPDDMFLFGNCLKRLGYQPTHSSLFHQARPNDYAGNFLASQEPISFHKFWMIDPVEVYRVWFAEADGELQTHPRHTEL